MLNELQEYICILLKLTECEFEFLLPRTAEALLFQQKETEQFENKIKKTIKEWF